MPISWSFIRSKYPALKNSTYLATAAVGPISNAVFEAQKQHLEMMYHQGDIFYQKSIDIMQECRQKIANLINCELDEVAFGPNTSTNMSLLTSVFSHSKKGNIVTLEDEFPSTVIPWECNGFEVRKVKVNLGDKPNLQDILNVVDENSSAVVISHQQFAKGYRAPLKELGQLLLQKKVPFIVNATQSFGIFEIDVKEFNIAALTASCHKWIGAGYGISVCYLNKSFNSQLESLPVVGWLSVEDLSQMSHMNYEIKKNISRIEVGVPPFNTLIGLNTAIAEIQELGVSNISKRVLELSWYFLECCKNNGIKLKGYSPSTIQDHQKFGSGTFLVDVGDVENCHDFLLDHKVYITARDGAIRVSMSYYNDESDIDVFIHFYKEFIKSQTS